MDFNEIFLVDSLQEREEMVNFWEWFDHILDPELGLLTVNQLTGPWARTGPKTLRPVNH